MTARMLVPALAAALALSFNAEAQTSQGTMASSPVLPEGCRTSAQADAHGPMMQGRIQQMHSQMQDGMGPMMQKMTETQKGLAEAMMKMNGPMMTGMMAKDADVAWICAMIPHHQGAIDMARAGLAGADNEESKKLAEETIASNRKEIDKLIAWVEKHAASESKDETMGAATK